MTRARLDGRIALFAGQTLMLGLFSGMLVIPASSLFLTTYGSARLPWTYVAGAAAALVGTPAMASAVRRWTLATVAIPIWAGLAGIAVASWALLVTAGAVWVSGPLLVVFPLGILVGFVLVGGQVGRVLDLREMKQLFPRVVVGLPAGFLIAGVGGDLLISLAGVEVLLLVATAAGLAFLGLVIAARRRFPALKSLPSVSSRVERLPIRRLLRVRYIVILLVYQLLSQLGTQLTEFLVLDRAAARYPDPADMGRFVARLTTAINVVDLLFLLVVAGVVLRRYGMRVGLSLNPVAVTAVVALAMAAALVGGIGTTPVFLLVVGAKVLDISLNDGATRTALNTAYQAVDPADRLPAQTLIEGFGVPVAIGLTGVILLGLQQGLGMGPFGITVLTLVVCLLWTVAGTVVYRAYRRTLREGLERRTLLPAGLELDDPDSRQVVDRLLASGDDRQVWALLPALGGHPRFGDQLAVLARSGHGRVARLALTQLLSVDPPRGLAIAADLADDSPTANRVHALSLVAAHEPERARPAAAEIARAMDDPDAEVRAVARVAAVTIGDPGLVRRVVADLDRPGDRVAAAEALTGGGAALAPLVTEALESASADPFGVAALRALRLTRCLQGTTDSEVVKALVAHLDHRSRPVALEVRRALAGSGAVSPERVEELLMADAGHAARVLAVLHRLPDEAAGESLRQSLQDDLDLASGLALAALALDEDGELMAGSARRLQRGQVGEVAHVVEVLEIHLSPARRALVLPLIDRRLPVEQRLAALARVTAVPDADLPTAVAAIAAGSDGTDWGPWAAACAVDAARAFGFDLPVGGRWDDDPVVAETRRAAQPAGA